MVCLVFHYREYFGDRQRGFVQGDNLILLVRGLVIGDGVGGGSWMERIKFIISTAVIIPKCPGTLSRLVSGYMCTHLG